MSVLPRNSHSLVGLFWQWAKGVGPGVGGGGGGVFNSQVDQMCCESESISGS